MHGTEGGWACRGPAVAPELRRSLHRADAGAHHGEGDVDDTNRHAAEPQQDRSRLPDAPISRGRLPLVAADRRAHEGDDRERKHRPRASDHRVLHPPLRELVLVGVALRQVHGVHPHCQEEDAQHRHKVDGVRHGGQALLLSVRREEVHVAKELQRHDEEELGDEVDDALHGSRHRGHEGCSNWHGFRILVGQAPLSLLLPVQRRLFGVAASFLLDVSHLGRESVLPDGVLDREELGAKRQPQLGGQGAVPYP
mmetsp:Transcript_113422/g.320990  ORF Transcript_113422/g.320990 Transcript_113422/m.320990 type:complete len:253 (+) Transcript_113422:746-1504(+)